MAGALLYDMVKETSATTGTGTLALAGASTGYRSFSVVGNGNTCYYTARHQTADEWEVGIGTYTAAGTTLARTTILASSNADAAVNFSAGTKDVILSAPAALVGIAGLTAATPVAADEVAIYDASATAVRKATFTDVLAIGTSNWKRLATATASSSATVNFTGLTSAYVAYVVVLTAVAPATDNVEFRLRTSTDGGANYDDGVSDYRWGSIVANAEAASLLAVGDAADSEIRLMDAQGSAANEKLSGEVWIHNPSAVDYCRVRYKMLGQSTESNTRPTFGGGHRIAAADVDAIRFLFSSGNIASGQFDLYGLAA